MVKSSGFTNKAQACHGMSEHWINEKCNKINFIYFKSQLTSS